MDFGEPFGGILHGARGAVLSALLRKGGPLTGRRVHALVGDHSLGSVQQALRDLEQLGLTTTETVGRAGVQRNHEEHQAIAPLRSLDSRRRCWRPSCAMRLASAGRDHVRLGSTR